MKRTFLVTIVIVVLVLFALGDIVLNLGAHSGVTREQITETLPGDDIIPHPWISIDRAAILPASASTSWPWVEQLGKDRAGWYAPLWLENILKEHAASSTLPQYQDLQVGQVVSDWGGGSLKVLGIQQDEYVLYGSIHAPATSTEAASSTDYGFTWALVLENDTSSTTSFHLRLRLKAPTGGTARFIPPALPGFIDYLTDIVMFKGLQERLSR